METNHPAPISVSVHWERKSEERLAAGKAVLCGFAALFAGIGLARFGYAPFVPALVHARWFTPEQADYLGAARTMSTPPATPAPRRQPKNHPKLTAEEHARKCNPTTTMAALSRNTGATMRASLLANSAPNT